MEYKDIEIELNKEVLENLYSAFDEPVGLQIFKTGIYENDIERAILRHKKEILNHIVYSQFCKMKFPIYDSFIFCMSGFIERTGRLPNSKDKIRIIKGRYYLEAVGNYIVSEIGFEIIPD